MRILLIIMADVLVVIASVLGVNEYFCLRRYSSFVVPFTDKMIAHGIIAQADRERVLREDRVSHWVGIALSVALCIMLTCFFAGVSAVLVFIVATVGQLLLLKPEPTETPSTRSQYFRAHRNQMDEVKYHAYLESVGDNGSESA